MKLPYTLHQTITTDSTLGAQWLCAPIARAFELLERGPVGTPTSTILEFLNDPLTFKLSEKCAFKASTAQSGSGKQSCSMGCAVYLFKVPMMQSPIPEGFWTSLIALMISADKFCVSGLRIVTALMGTPGEIRLMSRSGDGRIRAQWPNPTLPTPFTVCFSHKHRRKGELWVACGPRKPNHILLPTKLRPPSRSRISRHLRTTSRF